VRASFFAVALAIVGLAASINGAQAAPILVGTVTANYLYPNSASIYASSTLTVGTPLNCPGGGICSAFAEPATFLASGLSISLFEDGGSSYGPAPFNGIQYSNLVFSDGSSITGFTLDSDLPGLTAANVSFTGNSIQYNAQGDIFLNDYHVTLNLLTSSVTAVPEPITLSLFSAGLIGAAALRRRKAVSKA